MMKSCLEKFLNVNINFLFIMKNINKNKTEFNSLEFERLIQEERKTNPDYFKGEVVDNGDSFTITPSPFFMDLLKAINKEK